MWRVEATTTLIEEGYTDQLLFSHDVCMKIMRRRYGGFGYAHVLENARPMLLENGVDEAALETILVDNPRRILSVADLA